MEDDPNFGHVDQPLEGTHCEQCPATFAVGMRLQCQEESDHSTPGYRQIKNGQDLSNPAPVVAGNDLLVRELILMQSEAV
jgi:hypothetical protein